MKNKYTVEYFIKKFSKIPDSKWNVGDFISYDGKKKCALGWCGMKNVDPKESLFGKETKESTELENLLNNYVADINDGRNPKYKQETPKARILAALKDVQ